MPNLYPADPWERIRQLERDVEELKALLKAREPLTSASQGWVIGNRSAPPTPSGGGHLYASGGLPLWRTSSGSTIDLVPLNTDGIVALVNLAGTPDNTLQSAPDDYDPVVMDNNFRDVAAKINEIRSALDPT